MTPLGQPWERQRWESKTAYANFWAFYVNAPDGDRSYRKAQNLYRAERNKPPTDTLQGNWQAWSSGTNYKGEKIPGRLTWAERYAAYEKYLAEVQRRALHQKILDDAQAWADMQETALTKEREYADRLYKLADQMLTGPVFRRTTRNSPEGKIQVVIEPANWKLADISVVLRLASDLNRRGLLMPKDGALQEDSWRKTLMEMGLDPDDPNSWLDFFDAPEDAAGEAVHEGAEETAADDG